MRIAIVAPPWFEVPPPGYGGIERICFELVEGLLDRGHDVTLLATGENRTRARFIAILPAPAVGLGGVEHPVQEVRYAAYVGRALAGYDVDIVHDHCLAAPLLGLSRAAPTLLTAHGPTGGFVGDYYRQLGLPIVAISESQRNTAPDLPWVSTVPNAIQVKDYPFSATKEDFLLFVGRMSPEKGVHLAADAAGAAGMKLIIAGKCSEKHEQLYFDEWVAPRLGSHAEFIGEISGARRNELLSRARGLLVPALWEEPFGMVCIEALACGTPVIGLRRGAIPEIVDHERTGWICDEPAQLVDAIRQLAEIDPNACRKDALERYDTPIMVEGYERAYRSLFVAAG